MNKLRKPWQTVAWRNRRAELIKGKSCEWCGSKEYLTVHHPQKPNTLTDEEYLSLEGTMILCRRCAFVWHKGMHLCPKCRKKYASNRFEVCSTCYPVWKKERQEELEEIAEEYVRYEQWFSRFERSSEEERLRMLAERDSDKTLIERCKVYKERRF